MFSVDPCACVCVSVHVCHAWGEWWGGRECRARAESGRTCRNDSLWSPAVKNGTILAAETPGCALFHPSLLSPSCRSALPRPAVLCYRLSLLGGGCAPSSVLPPRTGRYCPTRSKKLLPSTGDWTRRRATRNARRGSRGKRGRGGEDAAVLCCALLCGIFLRCALRCFAKLSYNVLCHAVLV